MCSKYIMDSGVIFCEACRMAALVPGTAGPGACGCSWQNPGAGEGQLGWGVLRSALLGSLKGKKVKKKKNNNKPTPTKKKVFLRRLRRCLLITKSIPVDDAGERKED